VKFIPTQASIRSTILLHLRGYERFTEVWMVHPGAKLKTRGKALSLLITDENGDRFVVSVKRAK
jgi:hypothetical protein